MFFDMKHQEVKCLAWDHEDQLIKENNSQKKWKRQGNSHEAQQVKPARNFADRIFFFSMMIKVTFLFINPSTCCKFQCHSHYLLMCSTGAIAQVCIHEGPNFSVPRSSKIDCWGLQQTQKYHDLKLSQSTQKEPINQHPAQTNNRRELVKPDDILFPPAATPRKPRCGCWRGHRLLLASLQRWVETWSHHSGMLRPRTGSKEGFFSRMGKVV